MRSLSRLVTAVRRLFETQIGQTILSVSLVALFEWSFLSNYLYLFLVRAADSGRTERATLLEALAAKNRASLCGPEGDSRILSTLGTRRFRFGAHLRGAATSTCTAFSAFGFAALAPFRLVLETFVGEKHLLAGRKNKLSAALRTL